MQKFRSTGLVVSEKKSFKCSASQIALSALCGHVEFLISTKNTTFLKVHPIYIPAKFGNIWSCGFREEDENVKFGLTDGRTDSGHQVMAKAHMAF